MGLMFVLGLAAAMLYRDREYDFEFTPAGYVFWTVLMLLMAFSVGLVTEETRRERRRSAALVRERTLLEERQRIARDLHDTVLKTLHGLALEAYALTKHLEPSGARDKADYIQDVCRRSGEEISGIIQELRTDREEAGIATQLSEALTNIQKHASASRAKIAIELLPQEIRLEIEDDGKGVGHWSEDLNRNASAGKFGLLGMKERVQQINGQFAIESNGGTRISAAAPLPPET